MAFHWPSTGFPWPSTDLPRPSISPAQVSALGGAGLAARLADSPLGAAGAAVGASLGRAVVDVGPSLALGLLLLQVQSPLSSPNLV